METIKPFQNETESFSIEDLTVENRLDRISIYGSLNVTRDKDGLAKALALKDLVDAMVKTLQGEKLPDHVQLKPADKVDNPFK
jgi:hypothetical protein